MCVAVNKRNVSEAINHSGPACFNHEQTPTHLHDTHARTRSITCEGEPFALIGDGRYHKYTIDWHTGGASVPGHVEFYIDDMFMVCRLVS